MNFGYVPDPLGDCWPEARELLHPAVMRSGVAWGDVLAALGNGTAQLWLAVADGPQMALVTRMDGNVLEIWLCGGRDRSGWLGFFPIVEAAAREAGALSMRLTGRKGWQRVLRSWGWFCDGDDLKKVFRNG